MGTWPYTTCSKFCGAQVLPSLNFKAMGGVFDHGGGIVVAGFDGGEVHGGLHERADGAAGIERMIETAGSDVAAADHGDDIAAVGLRHDQGAFERGAVLFAGGVEALERGGDGAFGRGLGARVEAGVHGQAGGGEVGFGVVALEVPSHEIDVGGHVAAAGRPQP